MSNTAPSLLCVFVKSFKFSGPQFLDSQKGAGLAYFQDITHPSPISCCCGSHEEGWDDSENALRWHRRAETVQLSI